MDDFGKVETVKISKEEQKRKINRESELILKKYESMPDIITRTIERDSK